MLERLLRSRTFARAAQRGFIGNLKQVTAFLAKPDVKQQVIQRVADEVTSETRVIVGHSPGLGGGLRVHGPGVGIVTTG